MSTLHLRASTVVALAFLVSACAGGSAPSAGSPAVASGPRIVQPGAPGESTRAFVPGEVESTEGVSYSPADVHFMQGMIPHHAQALQMTALVPARAGSDAVRQMALRMEISQRDEIGLMRQWLIDHGEPVDMAHDMSRGMTGGLHMMPGMLSPEQMQQLRDATGRTFDRLFFEFMIQHHRGAIMMVSELFNTSGAGQESTVFKFASEVDSDQAMEITRMQNFLDAGR